MPYNPNDPANQLFQGQGVGAQLPNTQFSPVMPQTTSQMLTQGGAEGYKPQAQMDTMKQQAALQSSPAQPSSGSFDMKGMASALTKATEGINKKAQDMANIQTNLGQPMDMQAFNAQMAGMQPQAGTSKPMQMIQGFQQSPIGGGMIGGQPTRQQMMQRLQGR